MFGITNFKEYLTMLVDLVFQDGSTPDNNLDFLSAFLEYFLLFHQLTLKLIFIILENGEIKSLESKQRSLATNQSGKGIFCLLFSEKEASCSILRYSNRTTSFKNYQKL